MSKNTEMVAALHQAFNRRDFATLSAGLAEDAVYVDAPRNVTARGRGQVLEHLMGWVHAMSNAEVAEARYVDAEGGVVLAQFTGRGKQDGPLGPFPPSGKSTQLPFCEVVRVAADGKITQITAYYDQISLLAPLGHVKL